MPKPAARALLTDFLKTRRARLDPRKLGFTEARRRRSVGLRRSEVAQLAGISTAWYTLFEMGQERAMTLRIIEPVARALQLNEDERDYVYDLVRAEPAKQTVLELHATVPAVLGLVNDIAVCVFDRWHTPILWNQAAEAIFAMEDAEVMQTNALWRLFFRQDVREMWPEWDHAAFALTGLFRRALGWDPENADAARILEALRESSEFQRMWAEHHVLSFDSDARESRNKPFILRHPRHGTMTFYRMGIPMPASAGGYFRVQTPIDDASRRQLSMAVSHHIAEKGRRRLYGNAALLDAVQLEDVRAALTDRHSAGHRDNLTRLRDPFRK